MRRAVRLLLLPPLLAFGAACDLRDFEPPWKLSKLRVLGVGASPPELRPGEAYTIEALAWTPRDAPLSYRWSACWLGDLLGGGGAGGGGGGSRTSERASFDEEPAPTCFEQEGAAPLPDGPASGGTLDAGAIQGMLEAYQGQALGGGVSAGALPDTDLPVEDALAAFRDVWTLLLLGGVPLTVSLEVTDGVETLRANKRLLVRLVPPPGPPPHDPLLSRLMDMQDDEGEEEAGPTVVRYGYDEASLYLEAAFPGGGPPAGLLLRAYLPRLRVDPESREPLELPHALHTRDGLPTLSQGLGAAVELTVDPAAGSARVALADEGGEWPAEAVAPGVAVATDDEGTVSVTAPLEALGLSAGDPLAFLLTAVRGGRVVDVVPDAGRRWVYAGPRNAGPPAPVLRKLRAAAEALAAPLEVLRVGPGEEVRLLPLDEVSPYRDPYLSLSFWGKVEYRRETLFASWFTDQGELSRHKRFGHEPDDLAVTWTAPGATSGWEGTVHVVLRDGRGGTSWATLPVLPAE